MVSERILGLDMTKLLRIEAAYTKYGKTRSPFYADIAAGLMTKPVKIGIRAAVIPEIELDAIISARIAGKSDAEIRKLVIQLEAARKTAGAQQ